MTRLKFGISNAPFIATQTMRQVAMDYRQQYPEASDVIKSDFYVDDLLTGVDKLDQAI